MSAEDRAIILRVVENFVQTGIASDEQAKVMIVAPGKSSYVEKTGEDGRVVMLDEYRMNNKVVRAGYSSRSGTVFLSVISG
jgi:hypothetical protein